MIRSDLIGAERLEHHAISLAKTQPLATRVLRVIPLKVRVGANSTFLLADYRAFTEALQADHPGSHATEVQPAPTRQN